LRSIDVIISIKKTKKVSSIPRSILLYVSIVDIDIDTSKVSSIVSISISIFDINNHGQNDPGEEGTFSGKEVHY